MQEITMTVQAKVQVERERGDLTVTTASGSIYRLRVGSHSTILRLDSNVQGPGEALLGASILDIRHIFGDFFDNVDEAAINLPVVGRRLEMWAGDEVLTTSRVAKVTWRPWQ